MSARDEWSMPSLSAERKYNFSAGPATMPESVLRQAQEDIWNLHVKGVATGIGVLEHSHRGKAFDHVLAETVADCRKLAAIPDDYEVLFVQGGATSQCWQIPANFLPAGGTCDHFDTGKWARDAIDEVHHYGKAHVAASVREVRFDHIPTAAESRHSASPAYVQFCWNNTIAGTEWQRLPETPGGSYLICDATSNIFSRPIDVRKYGVVYAGCQKNLGPAGLVMLIVRKDLLERGPVRELPTLQRYDVVAKNESRYNTPPTFGVYLVGLMFKWILSWSDAGCVNCLEKIEAFNRSKARVLYEAVDAGAGFYEGCVKEKSDRSIMNVTFRLPTEALADKFAADAAAEGLDGVRGHRLVGGIRASIYNAMPMGGCEALAQFMREFARRHG